MKDYQDFLLKDFMKQICVDNFKNKIILEFGSDLKLSVAQKFIELGAKEIICVNPAFDENLVPNNPKIKIIRDFGENTALKSRKFDFIFGIALLEHVANPKKLFQETKRMLKRNGFAYLQGNPLYTGSLGHHTWVETSEYSYRFSDNTNPFEDWEHLTLRTKEDFIENLKTKNIPNDHIEKIINYLFSQDTSKILPSEIIRIAKSIFKFNLISILTIEDKTHNKHYEIAKKYYKEEDLDAHSLTFLICPLEYKLRFIYKKIRKTILILKRVYQI